MGDFILELLPLLAIAILLMFMSYCIAWLLRSKYTPIKIDSGAVSMAPLVAGIGLIALTVFCIMPTSCVDKATERRQAVEQYKQDQDSQRHSGQWYYGALHPDHNYGWGHKLFEAPVSLNSRSHELRFTFNWKDNSTTRTTSFSGERVDYKPQIIYRGTWFVSGTKNEGEWTLFEVSDEYYCGWVRDKGDKTERLIFLRRER